MSSGGSGGGRVGMVTTFSTLHYSYGRNTGTAYVKVVLYAGDTSPAFGTGSWAWSAGPRPASETFPGPPSTFVDGAPLPSRLLDGSLAAGMELAG